MGYSTATVNGYPLALNTVPGSGVVGVGFLEAEESTALRSFPSETKPGELYFFNDKSLDWICPDAATCLWANIAENDLRVIKVFVAGFIEQRRHAYLGENNKRNR